MIQDLVLSSPASHPRCLRFSSHVWQENRVIEPKPKISAKDGNLWIWGRGCPLHVLHLLSVCNQLQWGINHERGNFHHSNDVFFAKTTGEWVNRCLSPTDREFWSQKPGMDSRIGVPRCTETRCGLKVVELHPPVPDFFSGIGICCFFRWLIPKYTWSNLDHIPIKPPARNISNYGPALEGPKNPWSERAECTAGRLRKVDDFRLRWMMNWTNWTLISWWFNRQWWVICDSSIK